MDARRSPHSVATVNSQQNQRKVVVLSSPEDDQKLRIHAAHGVRGEHLPSIDHEVLFRFYKHLSANLSLPFPAYCPEPTSTLEEMLHPCTVLELLAPTRCIEVESNGIFCKTRIGKQEVRLPLIELVVSQDNPNFQMIEDYWQWFWR